jgi:serine/threonine protein kinase
MKRLPNRGAVPLHTDAAGTAPPDAFGPFRVLHQVGAGTLGPVYRAYDAEHDRLVAVKLFRLALPPEKLHRLVAEFERLISAELSHPGLAAPIATGTDGITVYLVRDFVAAESLDIMIRDHGAGSVHEALRVAVDVAGALDSAAAAGVHHGGLHPRDVLISSDEIRLTDLGVTRAIEMQGVSAPIRRPYAAPERIAGGAWDRRTDIFGLAALTYEMATGRRVAAIGKEAAQSLAPIPGADMASLRSTFARALAEDPADRFETALGFVESLKEGIPKGAQTPDRLNRAGVRSLRGSNRSTLTATDDRRQMVEEASIDDHVTDDRASDDRVTDDRLTTDETRLPLDEQDAFGFTDAEVAAAASNVERDVVVVGAAEAETDEFERLPTEAEQSVNRPISISEVRDPDPPRSYTSDDEGKEFGADDKPSAPTPFLARQAPAPEPFAAAWLEPPEPPAPPRRRELSLLDSSPERVPEAEAVISRSRIGRVAAVLIVGLGFGFGVGYLARDLRGGAPGVVAENAEPQTQTTKEPPGREQPASAPALPNAAGAGSSSAATPPTARGATAAPGRPAPAADSENKSPAPAPSASGNTTARSSRLLVRSTPAGARVFVDGREQGRTPARIADLTPGQHQVRIVQDGYVAADRRIVITGSQSQQSLAVTLERPPFTVASRPRPPGVSATTGTLAAGGLRVESRPTNANVFVDGKLVGTTPLLIEPVEAGEHTIRLELAGYRGWTSSVRVTGGQRNRVGASLEMNE